MNKFIEYLTVSEYETILAQLNKRLEILLQENDTKKYVEVRFLILKLKSIIEKHKKNNK